MGAAQEVGDEVVPDGVVDEDAVGEDEQGRGGRGAALEAVGQVDAVGSGDEALDDRVAGERGVGGQGAYGVRVTKGRRDSGGIGETGEVALGGPKGVVQVVYTPRAFLDHVLVDFGTPRRRRRRLQRFTAQAVVGGIFVQRQKLAARPVPAGQVEVACNEAACPAPARHLLQQRDVLLLVPPAQLVLLVLAVLQRDAHRHHDVLPALVLHLVQVGEVGGAPLGEQIIAPAVDEDLLHRVPLALRLCRRTAQAEVRLACQRFQLVEVVDGHPLGRGLAARRIVEVRGAVAEAVLAQGQTQPVGAVFVLVPVVELRERQALLGLHGHVQDAGGALGGHGGGGT